MPKNVEREREKKAKLGGNKRKGPKKEEEKKEDRIGILKGSILFMIT